MSQAHCFCYCCFHKLLASAWCTNIAIADNALSQNGANLIKVLSLKHLTFCIASHALLGGIRQSADVCALFRAVMPSAFCQSMQVVSKGDRSPSSHKFLQ